MNSLLRPENRCGRCPLAVKYAPMPAVRALLPVLAFAVLACSSSEAILRIYTSLDPELASTIQKSYRESTGRSFEYVRLSTGEALTRIRTEAKRPQAALWLGGPAIEYGSAAPLGLFEPYPPNIDFAIEPPNRDKDWRWTGIYFGVIGFASNKAFLKKKGLVPPASWADLLAPAYKGQLSYAYPYTSGTALMIVLGAVAAMGEEPAYAYFKALDQQVHHYTKSGSASVNQVGLGEIGVGIAFAQDIQSKGIDKGYPIELSFPKEGTGYEIGGVGLLRNGTAPELGKKLIDWILSVEAQEHFERWHNTPINPKVVIHPPTVRPGDVKLAPIDVAWASENHHRLVDRWRKVTGK